MKFKENIMKFCSFSEALKILSVFPLVSSIFCLFLFIFDLMSKYANISAHILISYHLYL